MGEKRGKIEREKKEERERKRVQSEKLSLLFKFFSDRTDGCWRSKGKSLPSQLELRNKTRFVEFRQLRDVGVFSFLFYSLAKSHFNG